MNKWKKTFSLILLLSYLLVGFLAEFDHDHEADNSFHDDCPACQWQVQALDNTLVLQAVHAAMIEVAPSQVETVTEHILYYTSRNAETHYPTRAPPIV